MNRQPKRSFGALALVVATTGVFTAPSARAGGPTCTYDSTTKVVTATAVADFPQIGILRNGDQIEVYGADCGSATRFNTDKIIVNDVPAHALQAFVDLSEGPFQPGATGEPGSSDEIEFEFNLGTEDDRLYVRGSNRVRAGSPQSVPDVHRINLNARESTGVDADVRVEDVEWILVEGTKGNDVFSAMGGAGTGGALLVRLFMSGGEEETGTNALVGGLGDDEINGSSGVDQISGGPGEDELNGGDGNDVLRGQGDADALFGSKGKDKLYGLSGNDDLHGEDGDDYLNGGSDIDSCDAGSGTNTVTGCE